MVGNIRKKIFLLWNEVGGLKEVIRVKGFEEVKEDSHPERRVKALAGTRSRTGITLCGHVLMIAVGEDITFY